MDPELIKKIVLLSLMVLISVNASAFVQCQTFYEMESKPSQLSSDIHNLDGYSFSDDKPSLNFYFLNVAKLEKKIGDEFIELNCKKRNQNKLNGIDYPSAKETGCTYEFEEWTKKDFETREKHEEFKMTGNNTISVSSVLDCCEGVYTITSNSFDLNTNMSYSFSLKLDDINAAKLERNTNGNFTDISNKLVGPNYARLDEEWTEADFNASTIYEELRINGEHLIKAKFFRDCSLEFRNLCTVKYEIETNPSDLNISFQPYSSLNFNDLNVIKLERRSNNDRNEFEDVTGKALKLDNKIYKYQLDEDWSERDLEMHVKHEKFRITQEHELKVKSSRKCRLAIGPFCGTTLEIESNPDNLNLENDYFSLRLKEKVTKLERKINEKFIDLTKKLKYANTIKFEYILMDEDINKEEIKIELKVNGRHSIGLKSNTTCVNDYQNSPEAKAIREAIFWVGAITFLIGSIISIYYYRKNERKKAIIMFIITIILALYILFLSIPPPSFYI